MKHLFQLVFYLLIFFGMTFCSRSNSKEDINELKIKEVNLPLRLIKAKTETSDTSFCVMLSNISERLNKNNNIQKPIMNFEYDEKWIISYKVKADKSFDIYVIEKHFNKNVRAKMLITTKKEEPTAVISAMMIAYENYVENPGKIESEEWEAAIKEDLSLKISKTYQVISANEKADYIDINQLSSSKKGKNEVEEFYQIEDDGNIVFIENVVFSKPEVVQPILNYRAIVAFKIFDENLEDANDEWMLNIVELELISQRFDIFLIQHYEDMSEVVIKDYNGNVLDTVNLSLFTNNVSMGYVLLHSRKKPELVGFQSIKTVLESVSNYFNIDIYKDEP